MADTASSDNHRFPRNPEERLIRHSFTDYQLFLQTFFLLTVLLQFRQSFLAVRQGVAPVRPEAESAAIGWVAMVYKALVRGLHSDRERVRPVVFKIRRAAFVQRRSNEFAKWKQYAGVISNAIGAKRAVHPKIRGFPRVNSLLGHQWTGLPRRSRPIGRFPTGVTFTFYSKGFIGPDPAILYRI